VLPTYILNTVLYESDSLAVSHDLSSMVHGQYHARHHYAKSATQKGKGAPMTPNAGTEEPIAVQDALRTEKVSMSVGPLVALRSVDSHLQPGEILELVGENGAGNPPWSRSWPACTGRTAAASI
jgi:ABC-type glutathione transport system ATPase component